jgi:hypothetical protein
VFIGVNAHTYMSIVFVLCFSKKNFLSFVSARNQNMRSAGFVWTYYHSFISLFSSDDFGNRSKSTQLVYLGYATHGLKALHHIFFRGD